MAHENYDLTLDSSFKNSRYEEPDTMNEGYKVSKPVYEFSSIKNTSRWRDRFTYFTLYSKMAPTLIHSGVVDDNKKESTLYSMIDELHSVDKHNSKYKDDGELSVSDNNLLYRCPRCGAVIGTMFDVISKDIVDCTCLNDVYKILFTIYNNIEEENLIDDLTVGGLKGQLARIWR